MPDRFEGERQGAIALIGIERVEGADTEDGEEAE